MICSPLEQFSIVTLFPLRIGDLFLSFTNSSLYLLIATGLVSLLFFLVTTEGGRLVPSRWQSVVEMTYQFVGSLVEEQIGGERQKILSPCLDDIPISAKYQSGRDDSIQLYRYKSSCSHIWVVSFTFYWDNNCWLPASRNTLF